jgi:hypothetical protein
MKDCDDRDHQFCQMAQGMAVSFAEALREYIGAPTSWLKEVDEKKFVVPYISAVPVDENWNEFQDQQYPTPNMSFTENNFYQFKISMTLEYSADSYPKQEYVVHCGVKPKKMGGCLLFVGMPGTPLHKNFHCSLSAAQEGENKSNQNFKAPIRYCIKLIMDQLSYDPFETDSLA